ncbi:TetR/AcrR family transcriptional regulator [Micromonospora sp. M12]
MQRIAAEAGVARSTFYTHFRDKSELLMRLAGTMRETSFDRIRDWDPSGPGDQLKALTEVFTDVIRIYRTYAPVLAAVSEVAAYDEVVRDYWAAGLEQFVARTVQALDVEQQAGRTPADLDVTTASRLIVHGGDRFLADHVSTTEAAPDTDAAAARSWPRPGGTAPTAAPPDLRPLASGGGGAELLGETAGEQVDALVLGDRRGRDGGRTVGRGHLTGTVPRPQWDQDHGIGHRLVSGRDLIAAQLRADVLRHDLGVLQRVRRHLVLGDIGEVADRVDVAEDAVGPCTLSASVTGTCPCAVSVVSRPSAR